MKANFINLIGHGCPDIWSSIILGVSGLWGCFWMIFLFELVHCVKHDSLPNVNGLFHPAESLNRTKSPTFLWVRGTISCLTDFELQHQYLPAFRLTLKHGLLGHKSACLWTVNTPSTLLVLRSSGPQTQIGTTSLALLGLQLVDSKTWDFLTSITIWANVL